MIELARPAESRKTHDEEIDVYYTLALRALERTGSIAIERIETLEQFDALKDDFERVYRADPHRNTFVSWKWLRAYFSSMAGKWGVLAARSLVHGRYVGFLPLEFRRLSLGPIVLDSELYFGINPTADYTGLIMDPDAWEAIDAFAVEIDRMAWDNFHVHNVGDPRVQGIIERLQYRNYVKTQPQNPCRYIPLPESWDEYLAQRLKYNSRRKMRSVIRTLARIPGYRFEEATAETFDAHLDALLRLNHERWQTNLPKARETYGGLFRAAFERKTCRIFVIWKNHDPVAAQAAFVDPERRSWDVYMLGYNAAYAKFSPGVGIIALTMRRAIEERYTTYDFLRGEEPYKERFATEVRQLSNWIVRRHGPRNAVVKLERILYYRLKAIGRRVLLGKPLATSSYCV